MTLPGSYSPPSSRVVSRVSGRLRQLGWASVPLWSLGLLAFVPFLRLAFVRRRARDWGVFAAYLVVVAGFVVLVSVGGSNGPASAIAGGTVVVLMGFAAVHAFVAFRPATDMLSGTVRHSSGHRNKQALATAQGRMQRRNEARELARANPALARELRIGRPDVPHEYDDGGLVDVNHVPVEVLASVLDLTPQEAAAVVAARGQLGRFAGPEELTAYAQFEPDRVDAVRDLMWFG